MVENLEQSTRPAEEVIEFESEQEGMKVFEETIEHFKKIYLGIFGGELTLDSPEYKKKLEDIEKISQKLKGEDSSRAIWLLRSILDYGGSSISVDQVYLDEKDKIHFYDNEEDVQGLELDDFFGFIDLSDNPDGVYGIEKGSEYEGILEKPSCDYYIIKNGKIVTKIEGDFSKPYEIAKKYNLDFRKPEVETQSKGNL